MCLEKMMSVFPGSPWREREHPDVLYLSMWGSPYVGKGVPSALGCGQSLVVGIHDVSPAMGVF